MENGAAGDYAYFFDNADCSAGGVVADTTFTPNRTQEINFGDGFAVPSGGGISVYVVDNSVGTDAMDVYAYGYSVPSGAVPAASKVIGGRLRIIAKTR